MGRRIERVARLLLSREPGPDLILLQEVWFEKDAKHIEKALGGTYERIRDSEVVTSHLGWAFGFRRGGLLAFLNGRSRWKVPDTSLFKEYAAHAPKWRFWQGDGLSGKGIQRFDLQQPGCRVVVVVQTIVPIVVLVSGRKSRCVVMGVVSVGGRRPLGRNRGRPGCVKRVLAKRHGDCGESLQR
jgi:hypothetical protein